MPTPRAVASRRVAASRRRAGAQARRRHNFTRERHEQGRGTGHRHRFGHDVLMRRRLATRQVRRATRRDAAATIASRADGARWAFRRCAANDRGAGARDSTRTTTVTRWDARRKYARANGGAGAGDARSRATGDARSARAVDTIFRSFLDVLAASEGRVLNCMTRRDARDVGRRGGVGRSREGARERESED